MNNVKRIKGKLILVGTLFLGAALGSTGVKAQLIDKGISPPGNTYRSYQDASIARDSGINQPLNLLNDFYPSVTVLLTDNSNIRRRPDIEEDDLKLTIMPSLGYRTNLGRHQFYAAYNGTFVRHQDFDREDAESHTFIAKGSFDLTRRFDLDVFAGFGDSFEQRGISGGRDFRDFTEAGFNAGPEEVDYLNYGADLAYGRKMGVFTLVGGFEHSETGYKNSLVGGGLDSRSRDREVDSVHLDATWQFASKTSLFGRIQKTDVDYDTENFDLDSEQTDYLIGLRIKPAASLSGVVAAGRSDKDFDNPFRDGYDGNTYYANLNYMINPFSIIELTASRIVEEPSDARASYYESELFGIGWNHALSEKWVFDAYAKWIDDDFDIGREDQFTNWGVGLDYVWKNWLTAGVFYSEIERESSEDLVGYTDSYWGIRLRSDLRSLLRGRGRKIVEPDSFDYPKKSLPSRE